MCPIHPSVELVSIDHTFSEAVNQALHPSPKFLALSLERLDISEVASRFSGRFPVPLSPLAVPFLRFAPGRHLLTKPNNSYKIEVPASLRGCSRSSRIAVRLPSGMGVQLRRNPHHSPGPADGLECRVLCQRASIASQRFACCSLFQTL